MRLVFISSGIELRKIFSRKKYIVLLLIQLALCFLISFSLSFNALSNIGIRLDVPSVPYIMLGGLYTVVLPLLIFMLASDMFAGEIENASIKCVLLRPISRAKIYLSKIIAILAYILINLLATFALLYITRLATGGASDFFNMLVAYVMTIVPMIAFAGMASLFALCLNNSSLAMFCSFIVYIIMQAITVIWPSVGAIFFTSHLGWYKMLFGIAINFGNLTNTLLLLLSSSVLFGLGGYTLFEKKQL